MKIKVKDYNEFMELVLNAKEGQFCPTNAGNLLNELNLHNIIDFVSHGYSGSYHFNGVKTTENDIRKGIDYLLSHYGVGKHSTGEHLGYIPFSLRGNKLSAIVLGETNYFNKIFKINKR